MTKPVVVTLPLALLLLDYWPLERIRWGYQTEPAGNNKTNQKSPVWLIFEKIPLLAMSAILSGVTFISQRGGEIVPTLERLPLEYRVANMFLSYIKYIIKTIWPSNLAVCYPHPHVIFSDVPVIICIILFMLMTAVFIYTGRRRKYAAVGWLWYVGTLVPTIGLIQAGAQGMANRYMYIPMLGLLMIITWAVKDFTAIRPEAKKAAAVTGTLVLLSLLILTRMQVRYWENSLTLFGHDLKVTKDNVVSENGYGCALSQAGLIDEAQKHFQNALRISPAYSEARNNLANVYLQKGMLNEAITCFNEIAKRNEATADIYYNLAAALEMQKKYDEAIKYYAKSLQMNPGDPATNKRMSITLLAAGKTNEAIGYAKRACELTSDKDAECLDALANSFAAAGRFNEAKATAEKALNIAKTSGRENLADKIQSRIKLYEAGQSYSEK
jgi:protein O-mannosyl-transferase